MKPIVGLAPMDGVSDHPFRAIQKKYGHPDVMYTEFTSVEGLCHGATRLLKDFLYDETQRPIVAQLFGTTPEYFRQAAVVVCELGFDGVDINMGCPAKNVAEHGAGAALIQTPELAHTIVKATQAGVMDFFNGKRSRDCQDITEPLWQEVEQRAKLVPSHNKPIPVSIKTRLGYDQPVVENWISTLLELEPAVIAVHGRLLKQYYTGAANWELIAQAASLAHSTNTLLLGNGDIANRADALNKVTTYGVDGVLIGRASFGNPYVFLDENKPRPISLFEMAIEHAQLYEKTYQVDDRYNFLPMRKHLAWYIKDIPHAKQLRIALMQTNSSEEVAALLR